MHIKTSDYTSVRASTHPSSSVRSFIYVCGRHGCGWHGFSTPLSPCDSPRIRPLLHLYPLLSLNVRIHSPFFQTPPHPGQRKGLRPCIQISFLLPHCPAHAHFVSPPLFIALSLSLPLSLPPSLSLSRPPSLSLSLSPLVISRPLSPSMHPHVPRGCTRAHTPKCTLCNRLPPPTK
jgi:hypothetical protein